MAQTSTIDPALLAPPDDATVARALQDFAAAVRRHYGDRLRGLYLFGSRARGDHTPESDADVAVVLADGGWKYWEEKFRLVDFAFDYTRSSGVYVQPWPFTASEWEHPGTDERCALARRARLESRPLGVSP